MYSLLHSIQIFIFYDYKKAIDIPDFNINFSKKNFIGEYFAKFNTNNSTLWLRKNYCSYNFSIKQGIIRKFILGNILLNSVLIFQCYHCIKTIDIPNFSVKMDTFRRKFLLEYILLHSILIFPWYDCIKMIAVTIFL